MNTNKVNTVCNSAWFITVYQVQVVKAWVINVGMCIFLVLHFQYRICFYLWQIRTMMLDLPTLSFYCVLQLGSFPLPHYHHHHTHPATAFRRDPCRLNELDAFF